MVRAQWPFRRPPAYADPSWDVSGAAYGLVCTPLRCPPIMETGVKRAVRSVSFYFHAREDQPSARIGVDIAVRQVGVGQDDASRPVRLNVPERDSQLTILVLVQPDQPPAPQHTFHC